MAYLQKFSKHGSNELLKSCIHVEWRRCFWKLVQVNVYAFLLKPLLVKGCCICLDAPTLLATEALVVGPGEGGWETDERVSVVSGWGECRSSLTCPLLPRSNCKTSWNLSWSLLPSNLLIASSATAWDEKVMRPKRFCFVLGSRITTAFLIPSMNSLKCCRRCLPVMHSGNVESFILTKTLQGASWLEAVDSDWL